MSGGSWDYFYLRLEEVAGRLLQSDCQYRKALGNHLIDAAHVLHEIEWVDSCDKSPPDDVNAIKEFFGEAVEQEVLRGLIDNAKDACARFYEQLENMGIK